VKTCEIVENNLTEYVDGKLSEELRAEIEVHISECEACRELAESFRVVYPSAEAIEEIEPSTAFLPKLNARLDKLESESNVTFVPSMLQWFKRMGAVAAVAVTVLLGYQMGQYAISPGQDDYAGTDILEEFGIDGLAPYPEGTITDFYIDDLSLNGEEAES